MSIVKWNPEFLTNANSFFDDFYKTSFPELFHRNFSAEGTSMPAVNVKEADNEFEIQLAAPGMVRGDFNVEVNNGVMTINAEHKTEDEKKKESYTRKEFSFQSFQRSFTLPESADDRKIEATYIDGVLHITLPKKPEVKPQAVKTIEVS